MAGLPTVLYVYDPETFVTSELRFGAVLSESPEDILVATEHAVETGSNIVDHGRLEPTRVSLEALVSSIAMPGDDGAAEAPYVVTPELPTGANVTRPVTYQLPQKPPPRDLGSAINALVGSNGPIVATENVESPRVPTPVTGKAVQRLVPKDVPQEAYDLLLEAQSKRLLCVLQTPQRSYFDLLITRVAKPKTPELGNAAKFQIDFVMVRITSSETVAAPRPTEARGALSKTAGAQSTTPVEEKPPNRSALKSLFG